MQNQSEQENQGFNKFGTSNSVISQSGFAPPNQSFLGKNKQPYGTQRRATGVASKGTDGLSSSFISKQKPQNMFGGDRSVLDRPADTPNESQSKRIPYSPFLKKRNLDGIRAQSFYTPMKSEQNFIHENRLNEDDDSTIKPDHKQNTVLRSFVSLRPQQNQSNLNSRLREKSGAGYLNSYPHNFAQTKFNETAFNNRSRSNIDNFVRSPVFGTHNQNFSPNRSSSAKSLSQHDFLTPQGESLYGQISQRPQTLQKMSFEERQQAIITTQLILEDIATKQADFALNDLSQQFNNRLDDDAMAVTGIGGGISSNNQYEFDPIQFQISGEQIIPPQILQEYRNRELEAIQEAENGQMRNNKPLAGYLVDNIIYFAIDKKLYLWNSSKIHRQSSKTIPQHEFPQSIQQICYVENYKSKFRPYICVATSSDIYLMTFKAVAKDLKSGNQNLTKQQYDLTQIIDSGYQSLPLYFGDIVGKIVQFKKTGRIFYASNSEDYGTSQIKELQIDGKDDGLLAIIGSYVPTVLTLNTNKNKKLKSECSELKNQSMAQSIFKQIVPDFLNIFKDKKLIIDIQIDEQRNVLYVLSNQVTNMHTLGQAYIDVYDLGILGDKFYHVTTITQDNLVKVLRDNIGLLIPKGNNRLPNLVSQYQITSILPILIFESITRHLLITTQNGLRIYIDFKEITFKQQKSREQEKYIEERNLQFDFVQEERPTYQWGVISVHSLPFEDEAQENYSQNPFPFQINYMTKQRQQNQCIQDFSKVIAPVYCNELSSLIYVSQKTNISTSLDQLNLCFISKNESAMTYYRQKGISESFINQDQQNDKFHIRENFSIMEVEEVDFKYQDSKFFRSITKEEIQSIQDSSERILQIYAVNKNNEIGDELDINLQRMLGYNKSLLLDQGWGLNNQHQYMPLSALEKQVYETNQTIKILTTKRQFQFISLRPIDILALIITVTVNSHKDTFSLDEFEDFAEKYSLQEVCNMLTQIVSDGANALYVYSKKIEQSIIKQNKFKRQQIQFQSQYQNQPRQNNRFGTNNFPQQSSISAGINRLGQSSPIHLQKQFENKNDVNPFYYQSTENLNQNCSHYRLESTKVLEFAKQLLACYGDSLSILNIQKFKDKAWNDGPLVINHEISTLRVKSLHTYLQRVLRPIWDLSITYRHSRSRIDKQLSNMHMFLPALKKLQHLLHMTERYQTDLCRQTTIDDQAALLHQQATLNKNRGINSQQILQQVQFTYEFDSQIKDKVEVAERKVIKSIMFFIRRCIDVIEYIKSISFQGDELLFQKMLLQIRVEIDSKKRGSNTKYSGILDELGDTCYKELVLQCGGQQDGFSFQNQDVSCGKKSQFMKQLFESSVLVVSQNIQGDKTGSIKSKAENIWRVCPTIFSSSDTVTFVGESYLRQALREKDIQKQKQMINQGLNQVLQEPQNLDLRKIVPILCKTNNFSTIVDLCLKKVKYLKFRLEQSGPKLIIDKEDQNTQIFKSYDIILQLFAALDMNINDHEKQNNQSGIKPVPNQINKKPITKASSDGIFELFYNHLSNKLPSEVSIKQKIALKSKIIERIEESQDKMIIKPLFEYMICQPDDYLLISDLPQLDSESFEQVFLEMFFSDNKRFHKQCLERMIKLMMNLETNLMRNRLCELVFLLCEDHDIQICNDNKDVIGVYLNCSEKIRYCQLALDNLRLSNHQSKINDNKQRQGSQSLKSHSQKLQELIDHFRYQISVIKEMDQKILIVGSDKKQELQTARDTLDITLINKAIIESDFINTFGLDELMLQSLQERYSNYHQDNRYNDLPQNNDSLNEIKLLFFKTFDRMIEQCDKSASESFKQLLKFSKYCQDYEIILSIIGRMWNNNKSKLIEIDNVVQEMVQEINDLDKMTIYSSKWFELMGHLYFSVRVAQFDQIIGSDLNDIFSTSSKINHPTVQALDLIIHLISLYLWTNPRMLDFNKNQSSIPTQILINEIKGQQHNSLSTDLFKQDLLSQPRQLGISNTLKTMEKDIETKELEWPPNFASAVKILLQKIKVQINFKGDNILNQNQINQMI